MEEYRVYGSTGSDMQKGKASLPPTLAFEILKMLFNQIVGTEIEYFLSCTEIQHYFNLIPHMCSSYVLVIVNLAILT